MSLPNNSTLSNTMQLDQKLDQKLNVPRTRTTSQPNLWPCRKRLVKMREGGKFMSDTDESRAKLSSYSECTYFFVLRCFLKSERNFSCSDLHALQWPRLLAARSCRNQLSLIKICEVKVITIGLVWRLCHFQNIEEGIRLKAPVTFYLRCYPKGFSFWWEFLVVQFFSPDSTERNDWD